SDQWKAFQNIKDNPRMMLDYLISTFTQLNDDEFSSIIEEIINTRKTNIYIQRKLLDLLIPIFFQLNDDDFSFRVKKILESQKMNTCVQRKCIEMFQQVCNLPNQQILDALTYEFVDTSLYKPNSTIVARAKNSKQKQISKIRSAIRKANKIRLAQFQRRDATALAAASFNQNHPKEASRFFSYGIMADKSIWGEMKVLIICFSYWNNVKNKPIISVAKLTDITQCNTKIVSNMVFETCKQKEIDPQKYHFWLTDNTAYISSENNGAVAKFNSLATSKSF
ncbi:29045_t:CDS:2, partial [Racocetra persica]